MNNFNVTEENNQVNIRMPKEFNFSCYKEFRDIYTNLPENKSFTLDFSLTSFIDSSALGMLLQLREHAGDSNDNVNLANSNDAVKNIFQVAKFDKLFAVD